MWLFTSFGFFSAVEHRDNPSRLLVRGRVREDIERLAELIPDGSTTFTPSADYPYRIEVNKREFAQLISEAIAGIEYDNFKDAVASSQSVARSHLYGRVWGTMHNAERKLDQLEPTG